jgi:hypothetical protein
MPRLLTSKEITYLDKLIKRNRRLHLRSREELGLPFHSPITNAERQIRARIRRKVLASVIDILKIRASGVDSVSEINNALKLLCDKNLSPEEKKMRDSILQSG